MCFDSWGKHNPDCSKMSYSGLGREMEEREREKRERERRGEGGEVRYAFINSSLSY